MIYRIQIITITRQAPTLMIHPAYLACSLYLLLSKIAATLSLFNELNKPASSYNDYFNNADLLNFSEYLHYALTDI